ncbi:MAG: hypothetical protein GWN01_16255 [Nitrosopumilaceae archaeon]|nr:hypothetical protein [Nitrosopumilaceae archaeon]NIU02390.1 hypothetical protein [Nitrosopumilaceae archaeon]NIU88847.1 hypothetical protein [Nitrosopumilaceae archaeon]NIV66971.1 hypothetical protein [Nitrosopumilaceae archaeon]NIX62991.1 hypothetical protein [Nitrosopumilaceae archaeon]
MKLLVILLLSLSVFPIFAQNNPEHQNDSSSIVSRLDKLENSVIPQEAWDRAVDGFVIVGSLATAILAFLIYRQTDNLVTQTNQIKNQTNQLENQTSQLQNQTEEMKKTNELAHTPCIVPRQVQKGEYTLIHCIQNIGTSSAKKIDLTISSSIDKKRVFPIALTPAQRFPKKGSPPLIKCNPNDTVTVKGSFQDIRGKIIPVDDKYDLSDLVKEDENNF